MPVEQPAIRLHHKPSLRPVGVDLVAENQDVCLGLGELMLSTKSNEATLKWRTGLRRRACGIEKRPDDAQRPAAMATSANPFKCAQPQQSESICLLKHRSDTIIVHDLGEIKEGTGNSRYRYAIPDGTVLVRDPTFVNDEPGPSPTTRSGHFDNSTRWPGQAPERGRTSMAEQCVLSPRQNRRHPLSLQAHFVVAECKDTSMQAMQAADCHTALNGAVAQTRSEQLPPRDNAVLSSRQRSQSLFALRKRSPSATCR